MKLTVTSEHNSTALTMLAQHSVDVDISCVLPYGELAKLYRGIEASLPGEHRVVQFVSAYEREGAHLIAFETAVTAAQLMGKRVLYIATGTSDTHMKKLFPEDNIGVPLDTLILTGRPPQEAVAQAAGTTLFFTRLRKTGEMNFPVASLQAIEMALQNLSGFFDLIVIDSPNILKDAFGMALARVVDGTILVVEAERTRAPVVAESKRIIESGGGHLIGAVLNKRRYYIPKLFYRIFFPHSAL